MFKNIVLGIIVLSAVACSSGPNDGKTRTPSGFEYNHVKAGGNTANEADYVYFTFKVVGDNGKVLQNLVEGKNMPALQIPTADKPLPKANPVIEMLSVAGIGDSLTLFMPMDSLPNAANNPQLQGMTSLNYIAVVKDIKDTTANRVYLEELRLEQEAEVEKTIARESDVQTQTLELLKKYKAGKLETKEATDGLKYFVIEEGEGLQVEKGMRAAVHYYGIDMKGDMFDNSFKRGQPYPFTVGTGSVIRGWDLGVPLFKVGGKGVLFIPYQLAYGEAGSPPNIGPKSDLVFYVEIADAN